MLWGVMEFSHDPWHSWRLAELLAAVPPPIGRISSFLFMRPRSGPGFCLKSHRGTLVTSQRCGLPGLLFFSTGGWV